jgi:hypothetical protein
MECSTLTEEAMTWRAIRPAPTQALRRSLEGAGLLRRSAMSAHAEPCSYFVFPSEALIASRISLTACLSARLLLLAARSSIKGSANLRAASMRGDAHIRWPFAFSVATASGVASMQTGRISAMSPLAFAMTFVDSLKYQGAGVCAGRSESRLFAGFESVAMVFPLFVSETASCGLLHGSPAGEQRSGATGNFVYRARNAPMTI